MLQSKEEVQYIKSVITDSLSSVQVKTRLACFSFLLLKFVFAAHFCASEFSLPEFRLFVLLRRTSFQESSGSVYYSIFDFQGSDWQNVFSVHLGLSLNLLIPSALLLSCFLRQLVYLSTRILPCQQEKDIIFEKNLSYFYSYKMLILPYLYLEF